MFCSKCGAQIPDGANFCHVCGGQLALAPQNPAGTALGEVNQRMDADGFSMDQKIMDKSSVMMPTGDRKNNEALFAMYAKLIDPVRALEILEGRIRSSMERIQAADSRKFKGGAAVFFLSTLVFSVFFYWWCFSKSTGADGVSDFRYCIYCQERYDRRIDCTDISLSPFSRYIRGYHHDCDCFLACTIKKQNYC